MKRDDGESKAAEDDESKPVEGIGGDEGKAVGGIDGDGKAEKGRQRAAWRVPDETTQREVAARISSAGVGVTPVRDRQYFKSIYFRIPGGGDLRSRNGRPRFHGG